MARRRHDLRPLLWRLGPAVFQHARGKDRQLARAHPRETIILSVKDEEGAGDEVSKEIGRRVYGILTQVNSAHNAPNNPNFHGMWHGHTVDCKLGEVRGRLILWQRFLSPVPNDDASHPGTDFNEMNNVLDNTKGRALNAGGTPIAYIQDFYGSAPLGERWKSGCGARTRHSPLGQLWIRPTPP